MKTFYIKTFGCKSNQAEGRMIALSLLQNGFKETDVLKAAYCIVNSCSVTEHADKQILSLIKQVRTKNATTKIVLTGCMAQLSKKPEGVDIILGNDEKLEIAKHLNADAVKDIFSIEKFHHIPLESKTYKGTRPFVKIQDGCDNRCAFCIVPFARGSSRSNSIENIVNQINHFAQNGCHEVVLTGIHIGHWGREFGKSLLDLLFEIEKTDILRYRLGSLYVNEITDDMIKLLAHSQKFCPHFHLSIQSLCDRTLEDMNRKYSAKESLSLIKKLKSSFNKPFLGCDIIAGFPSESEEDFQATFSNLKQSGLSQIHVFPYSKREGTAAAKMDAQVPEKIKKERVKKLLELSYELYGNFLQENLGLEHEVLFEKKSIKLGLNTGFTRNYIKVFVYGDKDFKNTIKVLKLNKTHLCTDNAPF
ncbi:threonylcarbamoyladenosine tRNA methylthiotransferase MtaB [Candidatus Gastranaerophilus sp. (ex Termes propinquus)]|nr:threonylcarbamoyladenosine tRNA methylthiotransferase MtaB [Candidatus Gastranaerophilus sp. (ex Termes propinquus)]